MIYKSFKIVLGVVASIFIAELFGLKYSSTAGIICLISIFETRRQTYRIGLKRIGVSFFAIVLSAALYRFAGHNLYVLGLFLAIYVPLLTLLKNTENLVVGTVLASHIYSFESAGLDIIINEMALVLVGISAAWVMSIYMLDMKRDIVKAQKDTEEILRKILRNIKGQLLNQCTCEEQSDLLEKLDETISSGMNASIDNNNNYILKDNSYFIRYFQMRRQQYQVLFHMNKYLEDIYVTVEEAYKLCEFTEQLAMNLEEFNTGNELMTKAGELEEYYKISQLPKTREEFENRSVLFRYFNDIVYFIEIKQQFSGFKERL